MQKQELVKEYSEALAELTPGTTGNLSVCSGGEVAITPTGVGYGSFEAEEVPVLSMDGERVEGDLEPSTEVPMHMGIYESFGPGAVVHTHSPWSTTLSTLREPVPCIHYVLASAGASEGVPVADYARFGTKELADEVVDEMEEAETTACLMANHGLVAVGEDLEEALETARVVEFTARVYCQARAIGEPVRLSEEEMNEVLEKWEDYGQ